ncbi:MAG: DNA-directed RNA polymerase subunit beta' [Dehalococcoidales bacterium]|nr:DNA-directed RNA polymerase subunit beta' [Dehalococcoidales bacterium]
MLEVNDFDAIRISLASPEQIRSWSYGEVTKAETINYRTLKPQRDGLFCEKIFGPTKDYECFCGKYKRIRYKGVKCDKCGVEVTQSKVRRERMGHIELTSPVSHIWFAKGIPSRLGLLLDLLPRNLERVLYFSHYIITSINEKERELTIEQLKEKYEQEIAERQEALEAKITEMGEATVEEVNQLRRNWEEEKAQLKEQLALGVKELESIRAKDLLTESQYQELKVKYGQVFEAGMGAEAILQLIQQINLNEQANELFQETLSNSSQRRRKASKRLQLVKAFQRSGNKPEWMILTVLPVLPPQLRPMVQLDGGKFAVSGINDLYRRVINRNNRLRYLMEKGAPEIIIRNEKRMLQKAVDALIDNDKESQAYSAAGSHKLKSLSGLLRGKQGRFRQNLLGKRVDYSGRSVIVVGPELKLHQCGLPRRMALELFKPFIMSKLLEQGLTHNIKSARRMAERAKPEIYEILEEVVKERPVLLNRAPTLHRLSIQAFEPVLIDGSAIQLHPMVCTAFNADFDGDQMAVHIPLSKAAIKEARETMMSTQNMLLPSSGEPIVAPNQDIVLGCYYLTLIRPKARGEGAILGSFEEAKLAYELGAVDFNAEIEVRVQENGGGRIKTSVGRILFNDVLPSGLSFYNMIVDRGSLRGITTECSKLLSDKEMAVVLDNLKELGFRYATKSGTTIAISDIQVPQSKPELLQEAEEKVALIENQYHGGLITADEKYKGVIDIWTETTAKITDAVSGSLDRYGSIYMMATSGAKGNISQITQMAGIRGLMINPSGRIIDFPIKASFREGLSALEYFISTHGARKGLADTALRTSESGYLTRRLIDVAHDVIVLEEDCGTTEGIWMDTSQAGELLPSFAERIIGRLAAATIANPQTGEIIVERNKEIDEQKADEIIAAGITRVQVRSPLSCQSRRGICQRCYGRDLGYRRPVALNTAVGIIAAQSIGEPGTQLTLRTFHTGGVAGLDITSGLPRVGELFEARTPRVPAIISDINGVAEITDSPEGERIRVASSEVFTDEYLVPTGWQVMVNDGQWVDIGAVLACPVSRSEDQAGSDEATKDTALTEENQAILAAVAGQVSIKDGRFSILYEEKEEREYPVPAGATIRVKTGDLVAAGQQLTDGSIDPSELLHKLGREAVQRYLVDEVQRIYRSQGVNINDKHIEIIVHKMLGMVSVDSAGDTKLLPGELVNRFQYEEINAEVLAEGGDPATAHSVLLGVTRASLSSDSWLATASFQETTRMLSDAAVRGAVDRLVGLKENVIIARLIPTRSLLSDEVAALEAGKKLENEAGEELVEELAEKLENEVGEEVAGELAEKLVDEAGEEVAGELEGESDQESGTIAVIADREESEEEV